jgi:organic hydroperoxide reductase OsmC/OhrA
LSEHAITVNWERGGAPFDYERYPRDHDWQIASGAQIRASAAPDYHGSPDRINPEDALVAAISSCHMLTFLAIAARKRWVVERYRDAAVGFLEKNEEGRLAVTRVLLRPQIAFAAPIPAGDQVARAHEQAHQQCFIASSVRARIDVEPEHDGPDTTSRTSGGPHV